MPSKKFNAVLPFSSIARTGNPNPPAVIASDSEANYRWFHKGGGRILHKRTVKCKRNTQAISARCELVHSVPPHAIPRVPERNIPKAKIVIASPTKRIAAFSLVEMLMALLVASLLLAALAPVITKRAGMDNINVSGSTGGGHAPAVFKCWDYDSPELQLAPDGSNYKVLPEDYPVEDAWIVNFIIASGGGGGAGATIPNETSHELKSTDSNSEIKIEPEIDEIDIVSLIGAGAGGGGGAAVFSGSTCKGSPSNEKCECMGQKYDSENKVCVSENLGSKNRSNAISACSSVTPANKWQLPTTSQLSNWSKNTLYSNFGVTSGQTLWAQNTSTGSCISTTYSCYCEGKYQSGYSSASACCSGCDWGQNAGSSPGYRYCGTTAPSYWSNTDMGKRYECSTGGPFGNRFTYCVCGVGAGPKSSCKTGMMSDCNSSCSSCTSHCNDYCGGKDSCSASSSCSSYNTNYYYYQLSGTSWTQSSSTSNTDSRQTYCVYFDSADVVGESFFSLSGGGGGGAPAIADNGFDSNILKIFRQKIKENKGGYLTLEKGTGGEGGNGASNKNQKASSGEKGGDSCIVIKDSSRKNKFKLCVSGGKPGGGADAAKTDAATTGWGAGGGETSVSNACYIVDYTIDSLGVETKFDCTQKGKPGGPGGASVDNPTKGGFGASSVLNNIQAGGTAVKDGVTASSANYGAGGGGGSAAKTGYGSSAVLAFGKGGNGADGYISIKYKKKFEAAGGGGGGGGYVAHIKKINVGKTATCNIKVGFGGPGGTQGAEGQDGGESSISCSNAPNVSYKILGGKGGKTGTSTEGGRGGEAGGYDDTGSIFTRLQAEGNLSILRGLEGKQGGTGDSANYKEMTRSAGGRGGTSGTGEKGKCGALYNETGVCSSVVTDENNDILEPVQNDTRDDLTGQGFNSGSVTIPTKDSIVAPTPKFGSAGAGGGGGAWHIGKNPGKGGSGQGGYVCIYWDKLE